MVKEAYYVEQHPLIRDVYRVADALIYDRKELTESQVIKSFLQYQVNSTRLIEQEKPRSPIKTYRSIYMLNMYLSIVNNLLLNIPDKITKDNLEVPLQITEKCKRLAQNKINTLQTQINNARKRLPQGELERQVLMPYQRGEIEFLEEIIELMLYGRMERDFFGKKSKEDNECWKANGYREQLGYGGTPFYLIRELITQLKPSEFDVSYDLGSGLGRVVNYGALITPAQFRGIDLVPERIRESQRVKDRLGLKNAEFIQKNVNDVDLSDGTIFYMFNPFSPETLDNVMQNLRKVAEKKPIKIAAFYGSPLSRLEEAARTSTGWVKEVYRSKEHYALAIFESR